MVGKGEPGRRDRTGRGPEAVGVGGQGIAGEPLPDGAAMSWSRGGRKAGDYRRSMRKSFQPELIWISIPEVAGSAYFDGICGP